MKLMIGIPTSEMGKNACFHDFFGLMDKPDDCIIVSPHGQSPARSRNLIIEQAILRNCTHILFIDDDTIVQKDMVARLARHDKDMVTGLYMMRNFPHKPILFDYADSEGKARWFYPPDGSEELIGPLVATGLGAVLIKIGVFEALERPWIRLGELEKDHWCDDIGFFKRATEAGFELYCDPTVCSGHMGTVAITPKYQDGKWYTAYNTWGEKEVVMQMPRPV